MKGRIIQPGSNNITATQKYGQSVGKRYLALREFQGKNSRSELEGPCVWHDMLMNKTVPAGTNWETPPPDLPSGDPGKEAARMPPSQQYRENYAKVDWSL